MLNVSYYTHEPIGCISKFDTFSITAYSKNSSDQKEDVTPLKSISISEKDLRTDDKLLASTMVSAIEALNVFAHKILHVDLEEYPLSEFIKYDFDEDEESTVFEGSCFLVKLDPEVDYASRNINVTFEARAPENFFLSVTRTSDGIDEYNKARQQWKIKDKELRDRFIKDAIREYDIHGGILGLLTRRISIEASKPDSLQAAIRILDEYKEAITNK